MVKAAKITHRERLEACLAGEILDRPPVALWRHFPVDDQSPQMLAEAALHFQHTFDFDLVKITPASSFCIKDWGVQDEWRGATEGTREYTRRVITHPEDWEKLPVLDPQKGYLADQLDCLRLLIKELGQATPILQTIFNPLSQAKNLVGGVNLLEHLRYHPDALHAGLHIITESTRRFIEAAKQTGIAGFFYAVQHAQYSLLSREEYLLFGKPYDMQTLEPIQGTWLNMLHLHGTEVMFDLFTEYPIQIINWHDRDTFPSLRESLTMYRGVACGGLQRDKTVLLGTPEKVYAEAKDALLATGGKRFILGTGCVVPITAPYGNLMAVRKSVERW